MTDAEATTSIWRLYWLTIAFGLIGFVSYFALQGFRTGLAFLLGAAISFCNLWLFSYLSRAIAPSTAENKPWNWRNFLSRYLLLFAGGYAITKALGVNPVSVVLGLFASTAAVITDSIAQLFRSFTR
jgi:hypothetical protein